MREKVSKAAGSALIGIGLLAISAWLGWTHVSSGVVKAVLLIGVFCVVGGICLFLFGPNNGSSHVTHIYRSHEREKELAALTKELETHLHSVGFALRNYWMKEEAGSFDTDTLSQLAEALVDRYRDWYLPATLALFERCCEWGVLVAKDSLGMTNPKSPNNIAMDMQTLEEGKIQIEALLAQERG